MNSLSFALPNLSATKASADRTVPPRRLVTTGFAAVDVTFKPKASASAGGTAVNVARVARRLGWDVDVVGTVGADRAGDFLLQVLRNEGIGTRYLLQDSEWTTPVVLQEQRNGDHVWKFHCPVCGARYARHRPSRRSLAEVVSQAITVPSVLFLDRTSLFALDLARRWRGEGTAVVFEPAMLGRPHLFDAAVELADLVKFSSERAAEFRERLINCDALLVETLGASGARFTVSGGSSWISVPTRGVSELVDSAGAGDWTTAGLIASLPSNANSTPFDPSAVHSAVAAAQTLGATACTWRGVFEERDLNFSADEFERFTCPRMKLSEAYSPVRSVDLVAL